jgi:hypothetical protein
MVQTNPPSLVISDISQEYFNQKTSTITTIAALLLLGGTENFVDPYTSYKAEGTKTEISIFLVRQKHKHHRCCS